MNRLYRLYAGFAIGILITFIIPVENARAILEPIANAIITIGRYTLMPVMFFGIIASFAHAMEQRQRILAQHAKDTSKRGRKDAPTARSPLQDIERRNRKIYFYMFASLIFSTVVLVFLGGSAMLIISLPRLPIIFQEFESIVPLTMGEIFQQTFPHNMFSVFAQNGNFILPIGCIALICGIAMKMRLSEPDTHLPRITIEISTIFDVVLNAYITAVGAGIIVIAMYFVVELRTTADIELFYQFITLISVFTAIIILIIYPLIALVPRKKIPPTTLIKGIFGPTVIAAISGDSYFSSLVVLQVFQKRFAAHKEIPHTLTLLSMLFGKAGSACIASIIFFMVLQSYSAIAITFLNAVWVMALAVLLSPLASASPKLGCVHIFTALSIIYGNGLEQGFLIIVPILPFLIVVSILIDTFTTLFFGYLFAETLRFSDREAGSGSSKRRFTVMKKIIS